VDLVHFSHTDYGFTDHPLVCRDLQRRYLDIALDAALATLKEPAAHKFYWTAETTVAGNDWWQAADSERRGQFLQAVRAGQLEISALPLNQTPTLNRRQWQTMLHWLPEDLWQQVQPRAALQDDVNGFPRAGAMALLDRGVHYLFSGINADSGGPPLPRPSAFWWKMPDGRKLFVWLSYSYPEGFYFFNAESWRRGPVPAATDTRYRPPRPNEIFRSDESSVRKAHACLVGRVRALRAAGYRYPTLLISMTNEWRMDNDPPFPPVAEFVAEWGRLGLKPTLRLTTVSAAMQRMEQEIGREAPAYGGEWTDWWANGMASGPREVAASRLAKRLAAAAESPLWGPLEGNAAGAMEEIYRDLCLFDEHTWGSSNSVALPDDLDTIAQYNEKARFAYRPVALARLLLSQRIRTRLADKDQGLYLANTSLSPWSGWVAMPASCLRGDFKSLEDSQSGARIPLEFRPGLRPFTAPAGVGELTREDRAATFPDNAPGQTARFWAEKLEGGELRRLQLRTDSPGEPAAAVTGMPTVATDENGWPTGATWPKMTRPLFLPGLGEMVAVRPRGFAPRWVAKQIWEIPDAEQRAKARRETLEETPAVAAGKASVERNPNTTLFTQALGHPRCRWVVRQLELWNREPRAELTLRFDRLSSPEPEAFFAVFPLPCEGTLPRFSNGGVPFVPYRDQLPGTCRDHFAIDGWVHYQTPQGHWLWVSRDTPLVTLGEQSVVARRSDGVPKDPHRVLAMLFNNMWYTNFVGDSHGVMEFRFELIWRKELDQAAWAERLAQSLLMEPSVIINPGLKESPIFMNRLYRP
jgi:hypothetical protein